ncbi:uncharacterized protein LOC124431022 [Vespa crabro]|uniref:uncharacterized protein LOC124431022 n=1 Tax=Vespa crabro TaxID=7445 RepID=UPI001EFFB3A6|nr:uncharacterized protein LOC124431022 [Vespa crabro]
MPSGVNYPIFISNYQLPCAQQTQWKKNGKVAEKSTIPGGSSEEKFTIALCNALGSRVLGSPNICNKDELEHPWNPSRLKFKKNFFAGTLNVNSLLKVGKQKELELLLDRHDIQILAVQEIRFLDKNVTEKKIIEYLKASLLLNCVTEFKSHSERMSLLTMKCKYKLYTFINCHAPINEDYKKSPNKVEEFWDLLDDEMSKIPKSNVVILLGDFNTQIGREVYHIPIVGEYAAHQRTNRNGMRLVTICKNFQMKVMSTFFRKLPRRAKTWTSPNPMLGEFQIDHVAISKRNMKEIMNIKKSQKRGKINKYNTNRLQITQETLEIFQEEIKVTHHGKWQDLSKEITNAAQKTFGLAKHRKKSWWNQMCNDALEERTKHWKKWKCSEKTEHHDQFKQQRKDTARIIRGTFKSQLKRYQAPSICVKDENGKFSLCNAENCEILAKHFDQLLNCPEPKHKLEFSETTENLEEDIPPNAEEIKEAIINLKNNKASGEDSITAELLKWSQTKIIKKLQLRYLENREVISKILLNRIEITLDKELGEYQAGFRKGRSCSEQIFNLKSIIRHRILNSKDIVVTFIDFKKTFDSVDIETIDKTIREFGVNNKLANLIHETLTDMISKIKFMGEISKPIQINTGVRQGDGLSPLLFNCVLEKIVRIWKIKLKEQNISAVTLGRQNKSIEISFLAFADDFAIVSNNLKSATTQINILKEIANKAREIIQENGLEKSAVEERVRKMERAYGITKNFYNERCLSKNLKIRHYATVVKSECLYASECPVKTTKVWILISNDEIYRNIEDITETIRKRRLQFFGHIYRMDESRLTKRLLIYLWEKKATTSWIQEVKKDLERNNISEEEIIDREIFRKRILNMEGFQGRLKKKPGAKWSEDRNKQHSEKMKEYWWERKRKQLSEKN